MIRLENRVFVANSGGWGVDSTISVLDVNTDQIISRIDVGKVPLDMVLDQNNYLWVYCKGYATYSWEPPYSLISETDAILLKIDPLTGNAIWQNSVGKAGDYTATPPKLAVSKEGDNIFYLRPEGVFKLSVQIPVISTEVFIPGNYYGIEVNPSDGNIYLFESSFTGNGIFRIYDTAGEPVAQGTVGIAPNGAVFNLEQE
jgi:YVTN family beta-propeller protein